MKNFITGFEEINPIYHKVAKGLGIDKKTAFFKVQLVLLLKPIISAMRIVTLSTIGMGTIASTINAGGLGVLLFDG